LTVDANVIHKVDTANPTNLHSMWTGESRAAASPGRMRILLTLTPAVFSRCADSVEQGRRLENLSWRLWQKEQFVDSEHKTVSATATNPTHSQPQAIPTDARFIDLPQLSGSVDSVADDEAVEITSVSAPLEILRPRIRREDSTTSSRSRRDRHISSDDFEKMIMSIVKDKAPLSAPTNNAAATVPRKEIVIPEPESTMFQRTGSTTTESQSPSKNSDAQSEVSRPSPKMAQPTTTVRGFSPAQVIMPPTMPTIRKPEPTIPEPETAPAAKLVQSRKQPTTFTIGGSYSSSEQGQSVENRSKPLPSALAKKAQFHLGGSSEEDSSLKGSLRAQGASSSNLSASKKQASFSAHVTTHFVGDDNAIDSDSEGDYVDESAIDDDDDSSDWEDSIEDSGKSSVDDKFFQRVPSKANLTSRRSLITLMLAQSDERAKALSNQASQSTSAIHGRSTRQGSSLGVSPNDSDDGPLMMKGRQSTLRPINEIPRSSAQPIATTNRSHAQAALSPRTTRRNMLATELTESLRRHLLWERSQKSSTANAVLKRRHTSHDVANLKQYPEKPCMKQSEDVNASSWNQYFAKEAFDGYHAKGW
jgi:hypothetical protein